MIVSFFKKLFRVIFASVWGFVNDRCTLKASALTYDTLLSIVPFLAVILGIAKGFGFEHYLENEIISAFNDQKDILNYAISFAYTMLQHSKESLITGVGVFLLLWTNVNLLANIENALNELWKVKTERSWIRRVSNYISLIIICPLIVVVSSGLVLFIRTHFKEYTSNLPFWQIITPYLHTLVPIIPFVLSCLLFTLVYIILPNAKFHFWPRLLAGTLSGLTFQFVQWIYINFQVEIFSYSVVYGTFAALPLFLVWLQISWLIVLGGAELAANIENDIFIELGLDLNEESKASEREIGVLILEHCLRQYQAGELPQTAFEIAKSLGVGMEVTQKIIDIFVDRSILMQVYINESGQDYHFQPARDAKLYTLKGVGNLIDQRIIPIHSIKKSEDLERINTQLSKLDSNAIDSKENITFQELLNIYPAKKESHNYIHVDT
jgi:membrane protein